jgi:plasmid segregation protein ParM
MATVTLGIDNGNGYVKTDQGVIFPSKVKAGIKLMNKEDGTQIKYNGQDYIVGGSGGSMENGIDRFKTDLYKITLLTAIALSVPSENTIEANVVLGIPVEYFKVYKTDIENWILGYKTNTITINGVEKQVTINKCAVFMESAIVFMDPAAYRDKINIAIDPGFYTTDVTRWDGTKLDGHYTSDIGISSFYAKVMSKINTTYKTTFRQQDMEKIIRSGIMIDRGQEIIVTDIIEAEKKMHVAELMQELTTNFNLRSAHNLLLIGGGALLFSKEFKSYYDYAKIVDDAQLANAKTFKKVGENLWKKAE